MSKHHSSPPFSKNQVVGTGSSAAALLLASYFVKCSERGENHRRRHQQATQGVDSAAAASRRQVLRVPRTRLQTIKPSHPHGSNRFNRPENVVCASRARSRLLAPFYDVSQRGCSNEGSTLVLRSLYPSCQLVDLILATLGLQCSAQTTHRRASSARCRRQVAISWSSGSAQWALAPTNG